MTSVVAVNPFPTFVTLLGFQAERRGGPRVQSSQTDRLAGFLAIAVGTVLDSAQRLVDFRDKFSLTIPGAKFQRPISFRRRAIGEVGMVFSLSLQMGDRLARFAEDLFFPCQELLLEILKLTLVHERLVIRRTIRVWYLKNSGRLH
ncbi:hypothetical protein ASD21_20795 [Caulobacter sp. Root1455]|nr:hypothetical protein ASD38_21765 [Caulobacter sp. Root487D2Y]KQZ03242.1 hypothetical protein ASD21_20795 [Caulobacter sp. Root1455]